MYPFGVDRVRGPTSVSSGLQNMQTGSTCWPADPETGECQTTRWACVAARRPESERRPMSPALLAAAGLGVDGGVSRGAQPCKHPDFSPVRPILGFSPARHQDKKCKFTTRCVVPCSSSGWQVTCPLPQWRGKGRKWLSWKSLLVGLPWGLSW